jgi:hypothetical protein
VKQTAFRTETTFNLPCQYICVAISPLRTSAGVVGSPKKELFALSKFDREKKWGSSSRKKPQQQKRQSIFLDNMYF